MGNSNFNEEQIKKIRSLYDRYEKYRRRRKGILPNTLYSWIDQLNPPDRVPYITDMEFILQCMRNEVYPSYPDAADTKGYSLAEKMKALNRIYKFINTR